MAVVKEVGVWAVEILITLLLAFSLVCWDGDRWDRAVDGGNASEGGDEIVNRLSQVTNPKPNDIIVFQPNGNEKSHYYVKRVVAVPGDTVMIKNGALYVNGEPLRMRSRRRPSRRRGLRPRRSPLRRMNFLCSGITATTARTADTPISAISNRTRCRKGAASAVGQFRIFTSSCGGRRCRFQWYPGHMTKAKRQMQEDIRLIDRVMSW